MKRIVAVSGGVDSVVLLDKLAAQYEPTELIVAHFDHGIRKDSADDALFVKKLAEKYGVVYVSKREELGAGTSEERARRRRYLFLRSVAKLYDATILTAHHADDVVETIAINITRGTGWRGVAALGDPSIERPLLGMKKADIVAYAKEHELSWREDETNSDPKYLRNALRQKLLQYSDDSKQLLGRYRNRQLFLKQAIDSEAQKIVGHAPYSRYLLIAASEMTSLELLRAIFIRETGVAPTRPQLIRALLAIKTYSAGKSFEVAGGVRLRFAQATFVVEVTPPVLS